MKVRVLVMIACTDGPATDLKDNHGCPLQIQLPLLRRKSCIAVIEHSEQRLSILILFLWVRKKKQFSRKIRVSIQKFIHPPCSRTKKQPSSSTPCTGCHGGSNSSKVSLRVSRSTARASCDASSVLTKLPPWPCSLLTFCSISFRRSRKILWIFFLSVGVHCRKSSNVLLFPLWSYLS